MSKRPLIARLIPTGQLTLFDCQSKKRKGSHNTSDGADEGNREGELGDTLGDTCLFEECDKCYS